MIHAPSTIRPCRHDAFRDLNVGCVVMSGGHGCFDPRFNATSGASSCVVDMPFETGSTVSCSNPAQVIGSQSAGLNANDLRYSGGQFHLNWQTPKTAGSCYRVTATTTDGAAITAYFSADPQPSGLIQSLIRWLSVIFNW